MKNHHDIYQKASLIKHAMTDELDAKEKEAFNELLEDERMSRLVQELSDQQVLKEELDSMNQFSAEKAFQKFQSRKQSRHRSIIFQISTYAAACLLVIGCSLWLYQSNRFTESVAQAEAVAVAPGSNQAKLILANGQEVMLGEGKEGSIQEDGAEITCENGELKYKKQNQTKKMAYNELQVPMGGECAITLDDGTKVWINAGSSLKYPVSFTQKSREVFLEGEAYFEVKKDSRPFIVKTSYNQVKVLGTSFGVTAYQEDGVSYTTLVTGRVAVKNDQKQELEIKPGEQVLADGSGEMVKRKVNVDEYVGWKNGKYVFQNQRLDVIMKTLERWYNIEVEFEDEKLKDIVFTGKLNRHEDMSHFLDALKCTGDLSYRKEDQKLILF